MIARSKNTKNYRRPKNHQKMIARPKKPKK